jgi:hypothetical protein
MVQISGAPPAAGDKDSWEWADKLGEFTVVDDKGAKYQPNGAWAKVKQQTTDKMVANYNADSPVTSLSREEGRPMDVWIAFNVPTGTHITAVQFNGKRVKQVDVTAH